MQNTISRVTAPLGDLYNLTSVVKNHTRDNPAVESFIEKAVLYQERALRRSDRDFDKDFERNNIINFCLHYAINFKNLEAVKKMLSLGANPVVYSDQSFSFGPAFHVACAHGTPEIIQVLLDAGADINGTENEYLNRTPLAHACIFCNLDNVRFLLENGANVNASDEDGNTPYLHACKNAASIEILNMLELHGADEDATNNEGQTAVELYRNKLDEIKRYADAKANREERIHTASALPPAELVGKKIVLLGSNSTATVISYKKGTVLGIGKSRHKIKLDTPDTWPDRSWILKKISFFVNLYYGTYIVSDDTFWTTLSRNNNGGERFMIAEEEEIVETDQSFLSACPAPEAVVEDDATRGGAVTDPATPPADGSDSSDED